MATTYNAGPIDPNFYRNQLAQAGQVFSAFQQQRQAQIEKKKQRLLDSYSTALQSVAEGYMDPDSAELESLRGRIVELDPSLKEQLDVTAQLMRSRGEEPRAMRGAKRKLFRKAKEEQALDWQRQQAYGPVPPERMMQPTVGMQRAMQQLPPEQAAALMQDRRFAAITPTPPDPLGQLPADQKALYMARHLQVPGVDPQAAEMGVGLIPTAGQVFSAAQQKLAEAHRNARAQLSAGTAAGAQALKAEELRMRAAGIYSGGKGGGDFIADRVKELEKEQQRDLQEWRDLDKSGPRPKQLQAGQLRDQAKAERYLLSVVNDADVYYALDALKEAMREGIPVTEAVRQIRRRYGRSEVDTSGVAAPQ